MNFDEQLMRRCLKLANLGLGLTYPNPLVGCVIVHDNKIIAEGWHQKAGSPHAEVNAIQQIQDVEILKNSTLYVSLEPCAHFGKTPPCADLIIKHHIPKVVIGTQDPFSKVNGLGIEKLRNAGIEVKVGFLEKECQELNKRFFHFHQFKHPYVILKWAETANGMMGKLDDKQAWISNSYSKQLVHFWRTQEQAILVGTNTAKIDNPQLNVRLWSGNQPIRVVVDRNLELLRELHLFDKSQPTLVLTEKEQENELNLQFEQISFGEDFIDSILNKLYENNIQSVIIEGGKKVLEQFIESGNWDEARIITSNKVWEEGLVAPKIDGILQKEWNVEQDNIKILTR